MMKLMTLTLVSAFALPALAQRNFTCGSSDYVSDVKVSVTAKKLTAKTEGDLADLLGKGNLEVDAAYKPRAAHAGSHRYVGANDCGDYYLIVDAKMVTGKAGHMTFQQDCDSDGTGPSFVNFECK